MTRFVMLTWLCLWGSTLLAQTNPLEEIIHANRANFGAWAQDSGRYELQVIYTRIERDEQGAPHFTSYEYGVDSNRYFYPASTVKMPAAFLALEKLNHLGIIGLNHRTAMLNGAGRTPQTPAQTDSTATTGLPSVGHYVRKIFLVSDNDAFNRLYEWLGQRALNESLHRKGYTQTRIIHRLSVSGFDSTGNQHTNPVSFYAGDTLLYHQGEVDSRFGVDLGLHHELRGRGYIDDAGEQINEPFDFRRRNAVALHDLHDMLQAVIFPHAVPAHRRFDLTPEDYQFIYRAMGQRPRESHSPVYDHEPDNYVKFWMYGDRDSTYRIPDHLRIYNKVGWAYGFLTDVAYIVDTQRGIEFMLAGAIHVNDNQIFNDGEYEYTKVGLPFFGELGRAIYEYEAQHTPPRRLEALEVERRVD